VSLMLCATLAEFTTVEIYGERIDWSRDQILLYKQALSYSCTTRERNSGEIRRMKRSKNKKISEVSYFKECRVAINNHACESNPTTHIDIN